MAQLSCGFQTFEHTADIGIRAWGADLKELFVESARGLFSVIADLSNISSIHKFDINLKAENAEDLLFIWLKELLFISDSKKMVFSDFKIKKLNSKLIMAEVGGEPIQEKHVLGREVKAITHHQFHVKKENNRFVTQVILDI